MMGYIYDILVNFNEKEIYEFFEWDKNDNIEHLRKTPIFKVRTKVFNDFKNNYVKISQTFLNKIKSKTEKFTSQSIGMIEYCAIITDGMDLVVIEFDSEGISILKSSMLLDEAEDTLEESDLLDVTEIDYTVINEKITNNRFTTRHENEVLNYISHEINHLIKKKQHNKLKYLYYEWFNKKENNINLVIDELKNILEQEFSSKHNSFFELLKLSNMKKQL